MDDLEEDQQDELNALGKEDLKRKLTMNDQLVGGNLQELRLRVASCIINGCMPRCPKCAIGKLKEVKDGEFKCPGGYDDDKYVRCSWKGS